MAEPFLAEIRPFAFLFVPKGWLPCDGRLMPINQNQALFSLLGTTYGGDGRVNFGLPDLQGRVPTEDCTPNRRESRNWRVGDAGASVLYRGR